MGWLRGAWRWARAADTTLSLFDMALRIIGASTVVSSVTGVVAWFAANPYAGLVVGLGSWIAVAVLLLVLVGVQGRAVAPPGSSPASTASEAQPEADDGSLPFPLPRPLSPDWESKRTLFNESFRFVDLITPEQAMNETRVQDKTFYRCTIHGPALVAPIKSRFVGNSNVYSAVPQDERPDDMLYPAEGMVDPTQSRTWWTGTVGVERCVFQDCTFVDTGFLQNKAGLAKLRGHLEGKGDVQL